MQFVKWILFSFLGAMGIVVLCIVGATLFVATAGQDTHRWMVRTLIESVLDRSAHVGGVASLDLGLHPTLVASDIWVENPAWTENRELLRLKRVEVQLELRPLFSGIALVPRLKIDGLRIEIEKNIDGRINWVTEIAISQLSPGNDINVDFVPLLELISLNDVTLTFRDRAQNQKTEIFLDELVQRRRADNEMLSIQGKGQIDKKDFSISGTFGSIQAALAATKPFPIHVSLDAPGLSARLSGTVADLGRGTGLKIDLDASAPSIQRLFEFWSVRPPLEGVAKLSARFSGDLDNLAVNNLRTHIIGPSGNQITARGTIANLSAGKG